MKPLHVLRTTCLVLLLAESASSAALDNVFTSRAIDICRIKVDSSSKGSHESLRISVLPGNKRAVAFSDAGEHTTESAVACTTDGGYSSGSLPPGCTAWPEDREPVSDVSECPSCPCTQKTDGDLDSPSNQILFDGIQRDCQKAEAGAPVDVLLFGMGGGEVHAKAVQNCPTHTRVESVEADARMAAIATKFFGVPKRDGVSVIDVEDGLSAAESLAQQLAGAQSSNSFAQTPLRPRLSMLRAGAQKRDVALGKRQWDVVAIDCFIGKGVTPDACKSREFLTYLRVLVRSGGTVMQHIWHTSPYDDSVATSFDDTLQLYQDIFGAQSVSVKSVPRDSKIAWDSVIVVKS